MSPTIGLPPPGLESCLVTERVSRFKGGTLIDEEVRDLAAHERRLCDPDGYRPARCPRCGHDVLHVHGYPERHPLGERGLPAVIRIIQYLCVGADCGATWRILPMFLARHLWRVWGTVERVVVPGAPQLARAPPIPARTAQRWRARLAASARLLVVLFAASGGAALEVIAARVGLDASRATLVGAHAEVAHVAPGARLSALAALVHRLQRGLRLM